MKFHEPFDDDDDPLPPLDVRDVDFRDVRRLAFEVLDLALRDAKQAPRAALRELRAGGWTLWLMILDVHPEAVERWLDARIAETTEDRPSPIGGRLPKNWAAGKDSTKWTGKSPQDGWSRERWIEAMTASATIEELERNVGRCYGWIRPRLGALGLLPRSVPYGKARSALVGERQPEAWAAE